MTPADTRCTAPTWAESLAAPLKAALQHPWIESIVRLSAVEDSLRGLHPMLSLCEVRARVLRVIVETADTRTFVLQANALWRGHRAGQFITLRQEIDGRRVDRVYSLSSRPGVRTLAITVKRQPGGLMSEFLYRNLKPGDVVTIGQADGDFTLPAQLPPRILLLSGGSGITPMRAMLLDLQARAYDGDLVLLHVCRGPDDFIYLRELQDIARRFPALRLLTHFSARAGRLSAAALQLAVPDLAQRETWLCGPAGMMEMVQRLWQEPAHARDAMPLHSERFAALPLRLASASGAPVAVHFAASGQGFTTSGDQPLLVQAERAGMTPKHGCRIGICRSCQCTKKSGTVENLQTGDISSQPNEQIRLCISAARSDITLDL